MGLQVGAAGGPERPCVLCGPRAEEDIVGETGASAKWVKRHLMITVLRGRRVKGVTEI